MVRRIAISFLILIAININSFSWGKTGHRIVGQIAENHLSKKAKKNIDLVLNGESLAMSANFMDWIKAEPAYNHMYPWHYSTIPDGKTYEEIGAPEEGDAIQTINRLVAELKSKKFTDEDEAFALKCLVHLIGDIHQPLHVGNGLDKGGNDISIRFFRIEKNLHSLWDSGMIDHEQLSYSEYASTLDVAPKSKVAQIQNSSLMDWIYESRDLHPQVYDFPESGNLSWRYVYDHKHIMDRRLLEAGIRLAAVLNDIYG
ncbi:MAG: S1/P1 nuclease [Bacteroidota bacterium]